MHKTLVDWTNNRTSIRKANIELSQVWGTSCLAELIYDIISKAVFMQEVPQTCEICIWEWKSYKFEGHKRVNRNNLIISRFCIQ